VVACEPPHRFVVVGQDPDEPNEQVTEVTLTAEGEQTILVVEQRGVPVNLLHGYGAGTQVHVEDLAAYLAGHGRCDAEARWNELDPAYQELAKGMG
jgi:activator of Hsp90 ATPase-like protein